MPAELMMMRCHLLGSVQASDTLQYKHGEKTRNRRPISWTSPPNVLHDNPCPNSWMIFTAPRATHRYATVLKVKNSWYAGSFETKVFQCVITSMTAAIITPTDRARNVLVKMKPNHG